MPAAQAPPLSSQTPQLRSAAVYQLDGGTELSVVLPTGSVCATQRVRRYAYPSVSGMHYWHDWPAQSIQCLAGEATICSIDLRRDSPNFGTLYRNPLKLFGPALCLPPGFAVGSIVSTSLPCIVSFSYDRLLTRFAGFRFNDEELTRSFDALGRPIEYCRDAIELSFPRWEDVFDSMPTSSEMEEARHGF